MLPISLHSLVIALIFYRHHQHQDYNHHHPGSLVYHILNTASFIILRLTSCEKSEAKNWIEKPLSHALENWMLVEIFGRHNPAGLQPRGSNIRHKHCMIKLYNWGGQFWWLMYSELPTLRIAPHMAILGWGFVRVIIERANKSRPNISSFCNLGSSC